MTDLLATPWSQHEMAVPSPVVVSFDQLAAPTAAARPAAGPVGDALATPWSGARVGLPHVPAITSLPTLAPTLPAQRSTPVEAAEPAAL